MKQVRRESEAKEREQLLGKRRNAAGGRNDGGPQIVIDSLHTQSDSLRRSNQAIDEMQQIGTSVLHSLHDQGDFLKATHRRILDLANMIGVSQSTLRLIERRHFFDKWLVYLGIFLTSVMLFAMWWYLM